MPRQKISVVMVKTLEEMQEAYDIRRKVFMDEQGEPEEEQFDGNDFCAAHLLAYADDEPVGTMRLRIVSGTDGGTIIWERMAILKKSRESNPWLFRHILKAARHYSEMMGMRSAIGIVENPKLMRFWEIYGGVQTDEEPLDFRGHKYKPMRLTLGTPKTEKQPSLREAIMATPEVFEETRNSL